MKRSTIKVKNKDGSIRRKEISLVKKLNYGISYLLQQCTLNEYHLPVHYCNPKIFPDYFALSTAKKEYHSTPNTAVVFYCYDRNFDNQNGLFEAIYYQNKKELQNYKKQFSNVKFIVAPDYSMFDNIWIPENDSRLWKVRIIMLWFVIELRAIVIPNAIYLSAEKLKKYLSGFEDCSVMCFSTKSHIRYARDRKRIRETVKYVVDNLNVETILVYSVCGKDETSLKLFDYAISKGLNVQIVDNAQRQRNILNMQKRGTR